jgi:hypothetical protein
MQLLWKRVESSSSQEQFGAAEAWCRICLHSIFDKAGAQNKARIARWSSITVRRTGVLTENRKIIQCALSRQDDAAAREAFNKMSDSGKDDPVTRYLMYKVGLRCGDMELGKNPAQSGCS